MEACSSFNSSVVRLIATDVKRWPCFAQFQFQCGAIDSRQLPLSSVACRRFQFQCGAIDRIKKRYETNIELLFQFQCGAIDSLSQFCIIVICIEFQFQCGAIDSLNFSFITCWSLSVSIPVWCD